MSSAAEFFAQVPAQDVILQLPIESIFIGDKRKKRFDPKNDKNRHFLDGMDKTGMINPVDVRPERDKSGAVIDGKYELVCGRRRLWAAKTLGWQYIMAKIGEWSDDEINYLSLVENTHRQQLEGAAYLKAMQDIQKEKERIWGANPGRRISGRAGAAAVQRDPVTKKFVSKPAEVAPVDVSPDSQTSEPLTASLADSGAGMKAEHEKTHAKRIEDETGMSERSTLRDLKTASAFTDEQLSALAACDTSKTDCEKLAKIKDKERRGIAINLVCTGMSADGAIAKATEDSPEIEQAVADRTEEAVSDEEWVRTYCAKKLAQFTDPTPFEKAAILYRRTREGRALFKARAGKETRKAHEERPNSLTWMLYQVLYLAHPNDWYVCNKCFGLNSQEPDCPKCKGSGFEVKIDWPKKNQ